MPDPFVLAVLLTFVTIGLALLLNADDFRRRGGRLVVGGGALESAQVCHADGAHFGHRTRGREQSAGGAADPARGAASHERRGRGGAGRDSGHDDGGAELGPRAHRRRDRRARGRRRHAAQGRAGPLSIARRFRLSRAHGLARRLFRKRAAQGDPPRRNRGDLRRFTAHRTDLARSHPFQSRQSLHHRRASPPAATHHGGVDAAPRRSRSAGRIVRGHRPAGERTGDGGFA